MSEGGLVMLAVLAVVWGYVLLQFHRHTNWRKLYRMLTDTSVEATDGTDE